MKFNFIRYLSLTNLINKVKPKSGSNMEIKKIVDKAVSKIQLRDHRYVEATALMVDMVNYTIAKDVSISPYYA